MAKKTYHPFLIIAFKTGILPTSLLQLLPRSTQHNWGEKNLENTFGSGWYTANKKELDALKEIYKSKRLMQLNLALLRIFAVKRFIHRHAAALKQGLYNVPATVYNNIKKSAQILGMVNALKLLGMAHGQYLSLKNKARCVQSPLGLCRAKHPAQLLPAEADAIKAVCKDEAYRYWPLSSVYFSALRAGKLCCAIATFYKYVHILGLHRHMPGKRAA